MTDRGPGNSTDWDPMKEDYNDSLYDPQYADNDSTSQYVNLDHKRLYIKNIPHGMNENGLRMAFEEYGQIEQIFISRDPTKRYALVTYDTPVEARVAMMNLNRTEPLNLVVSIAHAKNSQNGKANKNTKNPPRNQDDSSRCEDELLDESMGFDSNIHLELEKIKLDKLRIQEERLKCREKMVLLHLQKRPNVNQAPAMSTSRRLLPDGRVIVQERVQEPDASFTAGAGDSNETTCSCRKSWIKEENEGSSSQSTCVLCSEDRSVIRSKRNSLLQSVARCTDSNTESIKLEEVTVSKTTCNVSRTTCNVSKTSCNVSKVTKSDVTSKKCEKKCPCIVRSEMTCDSKFRDFYSDNEDEADETNRLLQLRNCDYADIVDDQLKVVIALAGYPKSKMRLRQMEVFQRCLTDVINMQLNNNLLQKVPCFLDYYLNRGAIACVCKDLETRDWIVRVSPGLQERMSTNLILLNSKVKRLCLAVLKIPRSCWPTTAQDCFKLLQYFNPSLKTNCWKIYSQTVDNDVELTSFLIDRVSGEIIRGPNFKNVIDYEQMEFELTGYTEIYYECLLSGMDEDLRSLASRVKLLEEIKSAGTTPRVASTISIKSMDSAKTIQLQDLIERLPDIDRIKVIDEKHKIEIHEKHQLETDEKDQVEVNNNVQATTNEKISPKTIEKHIIQCDKKINVEEDKIEIDEHVANKSTEFRKELERSLDESVLKKIKDVKYIGDNDEVLVWSDDVTDSQKNDDIDKPSDYLEESNTSLLNLSEKSESVADSMDNLLINSSSINIDSNRGIAYYRRTNYLHIENELKVAITLEGYPQNKLEGTHIRRLKHLFKEYLNKDMKSQRFANMIIPKFLDIYLSNGAVIYICDSLETKDYLTDVLPKFIHSTGLKLTFRDMNNLVRYTRIVMRLPKEQANVESLEILTSLQEKYPHLKPDCWKYYSDVAGKQKRQFGVDPVSLDVIKSQHFDPVYKGEKIIFRIIDRQKRDVSFEEGSAKKAEENEENKRQRQAIAKKMYVPVDQNIIKTPLTKIRTDHYSDLIADDLKLYVGPVNYPDTRIDEAQFHTVKRTFESILVDSIEKGEMSQSEIPKYHDMYLFDGVIFVICQDMNARKWIERNISKVNKMLNTHLKSTEFRGAVGIVSLMVKTNKDPDAVIAVLQEQNPRLRTKYWRKISTVKCGTKIDVVLQIDKLSAQVILDPNFKKQVDDDVAQFKLGHLRSLIRPKLSLEELTKAYETRQEPKQGKKTTKTSKKKKKNGSKVSVVQNDVNEKNEAKDENVKDTNNIKDIEDLKVVKDVNDVDDLKAISDNELHESPKLRDDQTQKECKPNSDDPKIIDLSPNEKNERFEIPDNSYQSKIILKIPLNILPDSEEDLNIIFDILEDKNPGLNTEIWQVFTESPYPSNGKFIIFVDRQSLSVIQNKEFDSNVGGEKLMFYF